MGSALGAVAGPVAGILGGIAGNNGAFGSKNTFSAQSAPLITQADLKEQIGASQLRYGDTFNNQNALARALLAQSQGQGPSLAQMQLQDATNRNIQQGAGLISSQKGINPALAARLIANQSANANQQAAGQSAQARLAEQMQAQQQLQGLYGQIAGQEINQNQLYQQALANQNQQALGNTSQMNQYNVGTAKQNADWGQQLLGGVTKGISSSLGLSSTQPEEKAMGGVIEGKAEVPGDSPVNDKVPAMLSPGEIVIPRSAAKDPEKAKAFIDHIKKSKSSESSSSDEGPSYGKLLEQHRKLQQRVQDLEKKIKGA